MASSVLPGERRWGSARRGGMTVLGKVAVPKPVNLPSQRLENHGLDPNVEIVPKGTLSWGSRSSSATQNAWGSSSLSSPNTDGGTGSPSRLNDRPSSGGSGTRPSTAGSEKSHEQPVPNIWGSNSRPLSASGVLASNKTLASASRPRSAETRPGSSQLSRFADPIAENSVAWGSSRTAEKLGAPYGKNDGFTLSSGDFPTLGSEKPTEAEGRNGHRSQERPVSASGRVGTSGERTETLTKEDESSIDAARNDWRNDNSPFAGALPRTDKWWMDAQTYPDPMMNSQQFGPWHGPVHNAPDGVWYRGPSGGPPFRPPGPPGPPGSYPVEPFPYYHPRLPAQPPANMQPVPRAVSGPSGYHANNGNSYRPHGPDPYMQPVLPVRPGAYAVPVPYEGYYGTPRAGFCNPNDRDPIMGMGTGPGAYNRFPVQSAHPETGNIQARQGGYDSTGMVMSKEQVEPGQPHGTHNGPYKVLLKQHDNWEENDGKEKTELGVNEQHRRAKLPGPPAREVELRAGRNDESVESLKLGSVEETSQSADASGEHSSGPVKSSLPESMNKDKAANDSLAKKPEVAPITGDAPQKNLSSTKKIPTLIEKIEGLNNKVRNSDGRSDAGLISIKDEKLKPSATLNTRSDNVTKVARANIVSDGKVSHSEPLAPSHERGTLAVENKIEASVPLSTCELQAPAVSVSSSSESRGGSHSYIQRRPQGVQSRTEHYGKTKPNHLEGDEWRKKPVVADAPVVSSSKNVGPSSHKPALECRSTEMTSGESDMNIQGKSAGDSNAKSAFDSSDHKNQRAKMREIAAQRARQLQKEEEERTREQKAKALAKLEELNRRTQTEALTERADDSMPSSRVVLNEQEEILANAGPFPLFGSSGTLPSASLNCNMNSVGQTSDKNIDKLGDVATLPKEAPPQEALPHSTQEIVVKHNLPSTSTSEISKDGSEQKIAVSHDSGAVKQKQTGNKRKQTIDKNLLEGSISFGSFGDPKDHGIVITSSGECHWLSNASGTDNQSVQHKKKNNRNSKNKQKVDTQLTMHMEEIPEKASDEGSNLKNSNSLSDATTVQELKSNGPAEAQNSQVVVPVTDQGLSTHAEEANNKSKHQSKPHPARWMPRNAQTNRMDKQHNGDNVVWAPVRSPLNKTEASEGAVVSTTSEAHIPLVNGHEGQNNYKSKRAEMERYVPKPVAKELSQQGNLQRPSSSSVHQVLSDENTGRTSSFSNAISEPDGSATGKGALAASVKNGENKHNKHGKAQGLWRQRVSADSSSVNPSEGSSFMSNMSKVVQVSTEQNQSRKADTNMSKERARYPESSNASNSSLPTKVFSAEGVAKDQGSTGRGKRQTSKGHKGMYQNQNNSDIDLRGEGTFESFGSTPGSNQSAGRSISGENQGVGAHSSSSSHWQPKPQAFVDHNRQTTKGNGGQKVVKASQKDSPPQGGRSSASRNDKQNSCALHPCSDSDVQNIDITGAPNVRHDGAKPERKVLDSSEGGPLPDQPNIPKPEEQVHPDDVNDQHGRSVSSGFRRHGHLNGRFGRGQDMSRGSRNSAAQEGNKQVRVPGNGDRRNNSSHYEYHPARSYNADAKEFFEEDSRGRSSRYREKGQTHSRHGRANYYERESGNIQGTISYDKGE